MRAPASWAPQEITRFYRGFLKYGNEFDKVSKMVGGGKSPDMCEALYRQHQAYLSLDKKFQSEVAFVAMCQDAFNTQLKEETPSGKATASGGTRREASGGEEAAGPASSGGGGALDAWATSEGAGGRASRGRSRAPAADGEEEGEGGVLDGEMTEEEAEEGGGGYRASAPPASSRPRRTPKRTPQGARSARRTPQSSGKRPRGGQLRDDDIYEYYDPALEAITESARKRRASQKRLDFAAQQHHGFASPVRMGAAAAAGGRRREAADEAKGIDALLSLAVAGEEFGGGAGEGDGEEAEGEAGTEPRPKVEPREGEEEGQQEQGEEEEEGLELVQRSPSRPGSQAKQRRRGRWVVEEEEEEREEDMVTEGEDEEMEGEGGGEEGGLEEDEEDEDYSEAAPRRRRTPLGTPLRARSRPGSAHVTPRRTGPRSGITSPGLRGLGSPAWLGLSDTELGMGELGIPDLSYLSSPGFTTALPPGYVPSPKNPMPRLRRRKYAPTKSPPVVSPFKSLFGSRRQSLVGGPSVHHLLPGAFASAYGAAGAGAGEAREGAGVVMPPLEVQLRHCLNARVRRWCQFEFFYSAIDRPWFMQNPLQALMSHLGMGAVSKLTRTEWSLVRAGLGKPRRLSLNFLREERARLEAWRESVRAHYASSGAPGAPPVDPTLAAGFPRALGVGQRVTARHPTTRQIHDGSVLTAAANSYRIQFDRRELGVELVRDCDIMPSDPAENLPPTVLAANPLLVLNGRYIVGGHPVRPPAAPRAIFPLTFSSIPAVTPTAAFARPLQQQQQQQQQAQAQLLMQQASAALQPAQMAQQAQQQQPLLPASTPQGAAAEAPAPAAPAAAPDSAQRAALSAAEAQALSELAVSLDKKEALLVQLRAMHDEAVAGVHAVGSAAGSGSGASGGNRNTSQHFKLAYAKVVLQLRDASQRVASKLEELEALRRGEGVTPAKQEAEGGVGAAAEAPTAAPGPETVGSLATSALHEARAMVLNCRTKLAGAAAEAAKQATAGAPQPTPGQPGAVPTELVDWEAPPGRLLGGVIEGCVWSLLALQQGCASGTSAAALAGALDTALQAVRPHAAANQQLYNDIRQAMDTLRAQLLVAT